MNAVYPYLGYNARDNSVYPRLLGNTPRVASGVGYSLEYTEHPTTEVHLKSKFKTIKNSSKKIYSFLK